MNDIVIYPGYKPRQNRLDILPGVSSNYLRIYGLKATYPCAGNALSQAKLG